MTRIASFAFAFLLAVSCATAPQPVPAPAAPPIWAGLEPGAYAVGFQSRLLKLPDSEFKIAKPHPIQMNVWYPAEAGGTPLKYSDFVLLSLTEQSSDPPTPQQREAGLGEFMKFLTLGGVTPEHANMLAGAAMYARLDAPPLGTKKFPIIYVAQGNGQTASAQAVLAEFLASHGYVVVTTPSITRLTGPMQKDDDVGPKSAEQMEDIEKAIDAMHAWPNASADAPVSLVAHSFGARGAMMYAMHHPSAAFVSLEGGIGMAAGTQSTINTKAFDLTVLVPPVLHFYELNDERVIHDFRLLHSLRTTDLELVQMTSMRHEHFTTDGFGAALIPDFGAMTHAGPGLKKDLQTFANQTLAFIEKQQKKSP